MVDRLVEAYVKSTMGGTFDLYIKKYQGWSPTVDDCIPTQSCTVSGNRVIMTTGDRVVSKMCFDVEYRNSIGCDDTAGRHFWSRFHRLAWNGPLTDIIP